MFVCFCVVHVCYYAYFKAVLQDKQVMLLPGHVILLPLTLVRYFVMFLEVVFSFQVCCVSFGLSHIPFSDTKA